MGNRQNQILILFHVHVVDNPTVNALAAPGGHIIVFRGLLEKTQNIEEMTGVLAHEMQHILLRHSMRLLVQQASMGIVLGALSGDVSGIMTFGLQAAHVLQTLSYSRNFEEQADQEGVLLLLRSDLNPQGMMTFFERIDNKLKEGGHTRKFPKYLSTHPSSGERIQQLQSLIPTTYKTTTSILPASNWQQVRNLCSSSSKESNL